MRNNKKTKNIFLILSLLFLTYCGGNGGSEGDSSGVKTSTDDDSIPQEAHLKIADQLSSLSYEELSAYFPPGSSSITQSSMDIFLDKYLSETHQILQNNEKGKLKRILLSAGKGTMESINLNQLMDQHISPKFQAFADINEVDVSKLDPDQYSYDDISDYIKSLTHFTEDESKKYDQELNSFLDALPSYQAVLDKNGDEMINDDDFFQFSQIKYAPSLTPEDIQTYYHFWSYFIDTDSTDFKNRIWPNLELTPPRVGRIQRYFKTLGEQEPIIVLDFKEELGLKEIPLNEAQDKLMTLSRDISHISLSGKSFYQPEMVTNLNKNSLTFVDKIFLSLPKAGQSDFFPKIRLTLKDPPSIKEGALIITPTFWMEFNPLPNESSLSFFIPPLWAEDAASNPMGKELKKIMRQTDLYQSDIISTNNKIIFDNITSFTHSINTIESHIQSILNEAASSSCSNNQGYDNDNGCKLKKTYQALMKLQSSLEDLILSHKADITSLDSILEDTPSAHETIHQTPYLIVISTATLVDCITAIKSVMQKMSEITAKRLLTLTDARALIGERMGAIVQAQLISYGLDKLFAFIDTLEEEPFSSQPQQGIKDIIAKRKAYKKVLVAIKNILQKTKDSALRVEKVQNLVKNSFELFLKYFGAGFIRDMAFDMYYRAEDTLLKKQNSRLVKWAQQTFELRHLKEELPYLLSLKDRLDSSISQVSNAIQKSKTHTIQVKNKYETTYQTRVQQLNQNFGTQTKSLTDNLMTYQASLEKAAKEHRRHARSCEDKASISHKASENMKFACRETNLNDLECGRAINASEKALKAWTQCRKKINLLKENFLKAEEELKKQEEFVETERKRLLNNLKNDLSSAGQIRKQRLAEGECDSHIPSISNLKDNNFRETLSAIENIFLMEIKCASEKDNIHYTVKYCYSTDDSYSEYPPSLAFRIYTNFEEDRHKPMNVCVFLKDAQNQKLHQCNTTEYFPSDNKRHLQVSSQHGFASVPWRTTYPNNYTGTLQNPIDITIKAEFFEDDTLYELGRRQINIGTPKTCHDIAFGSESDWMSYTGTALVEHK